MQTNEQWEELTSEELEQVIEEARRALELKQKEKRQEVIGQIKELAASAGLEVSIRIKGKPVEETRALRRRGKVPPKYRHPTDSSLTWSGRGQMPRWLRELVEQGHDKDEFLIGN